jgi:hypothetical protein
MVRLMADLAHPIQWSLSGAPEHTAPPAEGPSPVSKVITGPREAHPLPLTGGTSADPDRQQHNFLEEEAMRTRMSAVVAVVCFLLVALAAQSPRGRLTGTITDSIGGVLPGVTVTLSGAERRLTATTNDRGELSFVNVAPGSYEIRAELAGFTTVTAKVAIGGENTPRVVLRMSTTANRLLETSCSCSTCPARCCHRTNCRSCATRCACWWTS